MPKESKKLCLRFFLLVLVRVQVSTLSIMKMNTNTKVLKVKLHSQFNFWIVRLMAMIMDKGLHSNLENESQKLICNLKVNQIANSLVITILNSMSRPNR